MIEAVDLTCERGERLLFSGTVVLCRNGTLLRIAGPNGTRQDQPVAHDVRSPGAQRGEIRWKGGNIRKLREEYWKDLATSATSMA